jgi:hypothetical protein
MPCLLDEEPAAAPLDKAAEVQEDAPRGFDFGQDWRVTVTGRPADEELAASSTRL